MVTDASSLAKLSAIQLAPNSIEKHINNLKAINNFPQSNQLVSKEKHQQKKPIK